MTSEQMAEKNKAIITDRNKELKGKKFISKYGEEYEIIEYEGIFKVTIKFLHNGEIQREKNWNYISKGMVKSSSFYSSQYVGTKKVMNCGVEAEIIEYFSNSNITVKLQTGEIFKNKNMRAFKAGNIKSNLIDTNALYAQNTKDKNSKKYLGKRQINKQGFEYECIEYIDSNHIKIRFIESGYERMINSRAWSNNQVSHSKNSLRDYSAKSKQYISKTGLHFEVIEYSGVRDITLKCLEDGEIIKSTQEQCDNGFLPSKGLNWRFRCNPKETFHNFKAKCSIHESEFCWFTCECQTCKEMFLMTPQMMIKHEKECL